MTEKKQESGIQIAPGLLLDIEPLEAEELRRTVTGGRCPLCSLKFNHMRSCPEWTEETDIEGGRDGKEI